jgi:hypothetical protein
MKWLWSDLSFTFMIHISNLPKYFQYSQGIRTSTNLSRLIRTYSTVLLPCSNRIVLLELKSVQHSRSWQIRVVVGKKKTELLIQPRILLLTSILENSFRELPRGSRKKPNMRGVGGDRRPPLIQFIQSRLCCALSESGSKKSLSKRYMATRSIEYGLTVLGWPLPFAFI